MIDVENRLYKCIIDYYNTPGETKYKPKIFEEYKGYYIVLMNEFYEEGGFIICDPDRLQWSSIGLISIEEKIKSINHAKQYINWIISGLNKKLFEQCKKTFEDLGIRNCLLSIEVDGCFFHSSGLRIVCNFENGLIINLTNCYVDTSLNNGDILQSGSHFGELEL